MKQYLTLKELFFDAMKHLTKEDFQEVFARTAQYRDEHSSQDDELEEPIAIQKR